MHIIAYMAVDALSFRVFVCCGYVALLARRRGVQTNQRKRCYVVFEQHIVAPGGLSVTIAALLALLILVYVVVTMTGVTLCFQFFAVGVFHVTTFATQVPMTATQREFRVPVVIEPRSRPGLRRMAVLTLHTVSAFVGIVTAMTRDTFPLQFLLIQNSPVTTPAGRIAVLPLQPETSFRMIETNGFP